MPPLVIKEKELYTGFEIELWEKIANSLSINFDYKEIEFSSLLDELKKGNIDVALAGLTRTEERERLIDFTHFTLDTGLLVLINKKSKRSLFSIFKTFHKKLFYALLTILLFIIFFAHIIWFAEKNGGAVSASYFQGIGESIWYTIVTIATVGYGDIVAQTALGKLFTIFLIFSGVAIFGFFIAELSSSLTFAKMKYQISSHRDLRKKKVATKACSSSVDELIKLGAEVVTIDKIEEVYKLLEKGKVDAVVFDAPAIQHFLNNQKEEKFISVGSIFAPQTYGIGLQSNSKIKELINRELLKMRESGEYEILYKKWFGEV